MRKSIVYLSIALLLLSLGLNLVPNAFSQTINNINVVHSKTSWYVDSDGFVEVVGEVQNVGNTPVVTVFLQGSLWSSSGSDLSDSSCQIFAWYLLPNQIAPFKMEFTPNPWKPSEINSFNVTTIYAPATSSHQYTDIKITQSSSTIGTTGNYMGAYLVDGSIQNTGSQTAQNVTMVATFYNTTGSVVAVGYNTNYVADSLAPSATVPFQVPAYDLNQSSVPASDKITSYSLSVQVEAPILNGTVPTVTPNPTQTSSQTSPSSPLNSNGSPNSINTLIVIIAIIAVVAAVGAILALKRNKSSETPKKDLTLAKFQFCIQCLK